MNPHNTVFDAKRLIGRRFDDPEIKKDMQHWPFRVVDKNGSPLIEVRRNELSSIERQLMLIQVEYLGETKQFSPQEISSMVLLKMKEIAEAKLGKTVKKAVITCVNANYHVRTGLNFNLQCPCLLQRLSASGD